jgi:hypothetical protein
MKDRLVGFTVPSFRLGSVRDLPYEKPRTYAIGCSAARFANSSSTLKTTKALGLDVPPAVLVRADEVIE